MRTADRMLAREWAFPLGLEQSAVFMEAAADEIRTGPVVVADNVAAYVNARRPEVCLEGYPSLAPPWPHFWVEYPSSSGRQRRGVWIWDATEWADTPLDETLPDDELHVPQLAAGAKRHALSNPEGEPPEVRWVVGMALFIEQDRHVWGPAGVLCLALNPAGQAVGNRWSMSPVVAMKDAIGHAHEGLGKPPDESEFEPPTREELEAMSKTELRAVTDRLEAHQGRLNGYISRLDKRIREVRQSYGIVEHLAQMGADQEGLNPEWMIRALAPALQSVAFMHCRNVEMAEVRPDRRVQEKRRRRGRPPLVRYQTIDLVVPRRQSGGAGGGRGETSALHIVAGHFSHYGDCCDGQHEPNGKLFGRLEGVYWMPSHLRGDPKRGIVRTDFELETEATG